MSHPIDYSRPVGWWCPVCRLRETNQKHEAHKVWWCLSGDIPVYLPIPEGQRPLVEDEVATGEAEVVTFTIPGTADPAWCAPPGWTTFHDTAEEIYKIVVGINRWAKGATE